MAYPPQGNLQKEILPILTKHSQTSNDKQATTPDFVTKGHLGIIQAHCSAVGILYYY